MENPHTVLERPTLSFSSYKNRKLKVKLWWVGAHERKKRAFFVPFILSEGNFFNICLLSQYVVFWIHFQNIHTLHIKKHHFIHFYCLFLKSLKTLSVSLRCELKQSLGIPLRRKCLSLGNYVSLFCSIKCSLEVYNNTTCKFIIIKSVS